MKNWLYTSPVIALNRINKKIHTTHMSIQSKVKSLPLDLEIVWHY